MMRRSAICVALVAVSQGMLVQPLFGQAGTATTHSIPVPADPDLRMGQLPNGLRYYIRHNAIPKGRAELKLLVDAGSMQEDDDQRGLAHFVEHLAFNGTTHFPRQGIVEYIQSLGLSFGDDLNASTDYDQTEYDLSLPAEPAVLDTALLIINDWAHAVTMDPAAVEKERGIILEERRLNQGPGMDAQELHDAVLLGSRYASRSPIGLGETILHAPRSAIQRFYRDWYRPDLETVIAVGDFDAKAMEVKLRTALGQIPRPHTERPRPVIHVLTHHVPVASVVADAKITDWSAEIVYPKGIVDSVVTEATVRRNMIDTLFFAVLNARLRALIRSDGSPIQQGESYSTILGREARAYNISLVAKEPTTLELGVTAVQAEVARLARDGVTAGELDRARKASIEAAISDTLSAHTLPSDVLVGRYVNAALMRQRVADPRAEALLKLRFASTITPADLQGIANAILATPGPIVLATVPKSDQYSPPDQDELLAALTYGTDRTLPPFQDSLGSGTLLATAPHAGHIVHERTIPDLGVTEWILGNGARVLLKPAPFTKDHFTINAVSAGGMSAASDGEYPSAAVASALVMQSGLGPYTADALTRRLAGEVNSWGVTIDADQEEIHVQGSPRNARGMFQLLNLAFTAPHLDSAAVAKWRFNARRTTLDPLTLEILRTTTQRNPHVRPVAGPIADSVNADTALAFYRSRFADAGHFTFIIVGDFDVDSLRPLVEQYVGAIPGPGGPSSRPAGTRDLGIRPPTGVVEQTVVGGDSSSITRLRFDVPMPYSLQQSAVMEAMTAILENRVRLRLREQMSGVYNSGVMGSITNVPYAHATAQFGFTSAPERAHELQQALLAVIDTFRIHGVSREELQTIQHLLRRRRDVERQSDGYWVDVLTNSVLHRESLDQLAMWEQQVAPVTPAMIDETAHQLFDPNNYILISELPVRLAPVRRDELRSAQQW